MRDGECVQCAGGPQPRLAIAVVVVACAVLYLVLILVLSKIRGSSNLQKTNAIQSQLNVFVTFLQILTSIPNVFDSVPWPINFKLFALAFGFVNLEFFGIFAK